MPQVMKIINDTKPYAIDMVNNGTIFLVQNSTLLLLVIVFHFYLSKFI